jgi:hypothetical protein
VLNQKPSLAVVVALASIVAVGITAGFADWKTAGIAVAGMVIGLYSTYSLGQQQLDDLRRGARFAGRHVQSHSRQLAALQNMVSGEREVLAAIAEQDGNLSLDRVDAALYYIAFSLDQQLITAQDSVDDWADMLPNVDTGPQQGETPEAGT